MKIWNHEFLPKDRVHKPDKAGTNAGNTKWDSIVKGLECCTKLLKIFPRDYGTPSQYTLVTFFQNGKCL